MTDNIAKALNRRELRKQARDSGAQKTAEVAKTPAASTNAKAVEDAYAGQQSTAEIAAQRGDPKVAALPAKAILGTTDVQEHLLSPTHLDASDPSISVKQGLNSTETVEKAIENIQAPAAAKVVKHNVRPTRAEQRQEHVAQSIEDGARVPETTDIDMEVFLTRKPTLHELNQIAKRQQSQAAEEARVVANAAAKAAHGALLGHRQPGSRDPYAAKHASQQAMDAAKVAAETAAAKS